MARHILFGKDTWVALMMHDAFSLRGLAAGCALLFLVAPAVQAAEQLPDAPSIDARAWILMDYASGKLRRLL